MIRFILIVLLVTYTSAADAQKKSLPGKSLFIAHCSRCHGVMGGGGEGPSLSRTNLPRATNDADLARIISEGIPGTSMPGNWTLDSQQVNYIIEYVRSLSKTEGEELALTGDATKGMALFEKSGCASCHVINGKGRSLGPELSHIGLKRGLSHLQERLTHPGNNKLTDGLGFIQFLVIEIELKDGTKIRGLRTNEDTFSIQLRDPDNTFYSFRKNEVKSINRFEGESLMPAFDSLSESDRNDIVAYLTSLR
jgi:putative heme-binding domain-containing protein